MKIVVTGSLGNISLPLTKTLLANGHAITVISSDPSKQATINALGASAAIGTLDDVPFLTNTFTGADAVYCMIPPNYAAPDPVMYYSRLAHNYAAAIRNANVRRVVVLSSYGAHLEKGTGFITGSYHVEQILNAVTGLQITHVRPGYFYYNLFNFIPMIKAAGFIGTNYGGEDKLLLVAPTDIAAVVAEELTTNSINKIRYIVSDERSCNDVAQVLGASIGIPDLAWVTLSDEQTLAGLISNGVPENAAASFVELGAAIHSGILHSDYVHQSSPLGNVKLESFATAFAYAFRQTTQNKDHQ